MDGTAFIEELKNSPDTEPEGDVFQTIWEKYENVIIQSLVTSFGLDFLVHDQDGGDVDTILNVRKADKNEGEDLRLDYKNLYNKERYNSREAYDGNAYHSDVRYRETVKQARQKFDTNGTMISDTYVKGNTVIPRNNKTITTGRQGQLDHVISANEIHNDPGRILAGLDGKELANSPYNLRYTNAALNNNMRDKNPEEYIKWCDEHPNQVNYNGERGKPLPETVKKKIRSERKRAQEIYDAKLAKAYYSSSGFYSDTAVAVGKRGAEMALRQALGFVFAEIWLCSKKEIQSIPVESKIEDTFIAVGNGIKNGLESAKLKYKDVISKIEEGFTAGALASLTTTLCNIFFTTAKNVVRFIRQIYASVVQAGKVLLFNPDDLKPGDRIKTATVILATGASVLVGTVVADLIGKTPIGAAPVVGQIVTTFCSTMVSGLLSCTLLVFLDRSKFINDLVDSLNEGPELIADYKTIADEMEVIAVRIANLDIESFREETIRYSDVAKNINECKTQEELNVVLMRVYSSLGIRIPWEGDFDAFMSNKSNHLTFRRSSK